MRTNFRTPGGFLAAAGMAALLLSAGCGNGRDEAGGKPLIGYVPQSAFASNVSVAYYRGVVDAIGDHGYEAVVHNPDFDAARQVAMIEDLIAENRVAGLVIHPIDVVMIAGALRQINREGIPVVGCVAEARGGELLITVKNDVVLEGRMCAERLARKLKEKYGEVRGKVLEVHGGLQDDVARGRSRGYRELMEQYPGVRTITREAANWSIPLAEQAVRDVLVAHSDLDAVFSHADYFSDAIESGLESSGMLLPAGEPGHVFWASVDGNPTALERIRKGLMDYTVNNACYAYGQLAVGYLASFLESGELPKLGDEVVNEDALWSPARIVEGQSGPVLILSPFGIDRRTVDNPLLWGNREWERTVSDERQG